MGKVDTTRERILAAALNQISVEGLAGVSIGALAQSVGLSKSGLYAHFGSRAGLHEAIVDATLARFAQHIWAPFADDEPGEKRLKSIIEKWLEWTGGEVFSGGCPITIVAAELGPADGAALEKLRLAQQRWLRQIAREFAAVGDRAAVAAKDEQAAFELYGLVMGYGFQKRVLADAASRAKFDKAVRRLISSAS